MSEYSGSVIVVFFLAISCHSSFLGFGLDKIESLVAVTTRFLGAGSDAGGAGGFAWGCSMAAGGVSSGVITGDSAGAAALGGAAFWPDALGLRTDLGLGGAGFTSFRSAVF